MGTVGKDLRLIAVVGSIDDTELDKIELEIVDQDMAFNGTHQEGYYTDADEMLNSLERSVAKGEFWSLWKKVSLIKE